MVKTIFILGIFSVIIFSSCTEKFSELVLSRKNYTGNQLAINGYFYSFSQTSTGKTYGTIIVLYENGTFLYVGSPDATTVDELNKEVVRVNGFGPRQFRQGLGVFQIENSQIKIERWLENSNGPIPRMIFNGQILNDTTFRMALFKDVKDWKFCPFSPKPDSTNQFIK